jgi:hypothetical protein
MAAPVNDATWLAWIEQLMGASARSASETEFPRSLFHCRLDDQPDHLVPQSFLLRPGFWEGLTDRPLSVNPTCFFAPNGDLPSEIDFWPREKFPPPHGVLWIRDPARGLQPFWINPEVAAWLRSVKPGDPAPLPLSPEALRTLAMANVLVPESYVFDRRKEWAETVSVCRLQFQQRGYVPVARLIHPFHVAALRRYYRHHIRTGNIALGDHQSPLRYVVHNEGVARFFHHRLTAAVTAIAGEPVKPSYVYMASYQPGAILKKHTDREQCEFSVTLCLDYAPEPRAATPWPLQLHLETGKVTVFQAIGDALLYRGRTIPHSRDPLPAGHTSTSLFFHYVRQDFAGSLE